MSTYFDVEVFPPLYCKLYVLDDLSIKLNSINTKFHMSISHLNIRSCKKNLQNLQNLLNTLMFSFPVI